MENNIELFEKYVLEKLTPEEAAGFESRLKRDSGFAQDFRIYLYTLKGIQTEAEQEDIEFGHAMKNISRSQLLGIMERSNLPKMLRLRYLRERLAWVSSVAALLVIGFFSVFFVNRSNQYKYDNLIVDYNYVYEDKGGDIKYETAHAGNREDEINKPEDEIRKMIPSLLEAYRSSSTEDLQASEAAGMRLAMAYLKVHDRKAAIEILEEMKKRFEGDVEFTAQCDKIISLLK